MTEDRLRELETDPTLNLQEACTEIRRCHKRIDDLLVSNTQEVERRTAAELRARNAESCRALEEATARVLGRIAGKTC